MFNLESKFWIPLEGPNFHFHLIKLVEKYFRLSFEPAMQTRSKAKSDRVEQLRDAPPLDLLPPHLHHLGLPGKTNVARSPAGALQALSKHLGITNSKALTPSGSMRRASMATATSTPKRFHLRRLKRFTSSSTMSTIQQQEEDDSSINLPTSSSTTSSYHTSPTGGNDTFTVTSSHMLPCITNLTTCPSNLSPIIGGNVATTVNSTCTSLSASYDCSALATMNTMATVNSSNRVSSVSCEDSLSFYVNGRGRSPGKRLRVKSFSLPIFFSISMF